MLAKDYIQSMLETEILPSLAGFVKKNYTKVEQKVIQGEFYTLIRRHLPDLVKERASYSISIHNIDLIGIDRDGNIISLGFSRTGYSRDRTNETVETLNELLKDASFDYSKSILAHNLDQITDSLRYAQC